MLVSAMTYNLGSWSIKKNTHLLKIIKQNMLSMLTSIG